MIHQPSLREIHSRMSGKLSDKWDIYLEIYDQLLSRHRSQSINILEIGVQNGGSLETWGTYFENAEIIIGCDIDAKCKDLRFDDHRVHVIIGDATSKNTAKEIDKLAQSFDLIIEDGSHTSRDIITTFAEFFPRLRPGGLYIAEDLHCCYWKDWGGGLSYPYSGIEFFKALCDCLNANHWHRKDTTQAEYINNIGRHHGVVISNELLDSIMSIEFYDSICVLKKAEEGKPSRLNERIIGGCDETVASGHNQFERLMPLVPQKSARLTGLASFALEVMTLSEDNARLTQDNMRLAEDNVRLTSENKTLLANLAKIQRSLSWKLTSPIRSAANTFNALMPLIGLSLRNKNNAPS